MRVLHVLSQRPSHTGSGITLKALISGGNKRDIDSAAVIGVPAVCKDPVLDELPKEKVFRVPFETEALPFPVPGMSDVMPYPSTRFSCLDEPDLERYRKAWLNVLRKACDVFRPDVIHSHHVWIVSSLVKDAAPEVKQVIHCHATGLRQMELCPALAEEVMQGCRRADVFCVLHDGHGSELSNRLIESRSNDAGVWPGRTCSRIHVVGAGYRDDIFKSGPADSSIRVPGVSRLIYVGKYSGAKGLPQLLDAFEILTGVHQDVELHVAGSGAGEEARMLEERMKSMAPRVVLHGQVSQEELAEIMQGCEVCVLPSFYEGVPLVLVEALGCGCRLVSTALPGVVAGIVPHVGDAIELVDLPRLESVDKPVSADIPAFTQRIADACERALEKGRFQGDLRRDLEARLSHFTWDAVFERVHDIWKSLCS